MKGVMSNMNRKQLLGRAVGVSLTLSLMAAPFVAPADMMPTAFSISVAEAAAAVGPTDVVLVRYRRSSVLVRIGRQLMARRR